MLWRLLPAASLNHAHFTPKTSHLRPANCFVSLHVNAGEGHWKESYSSGDADFRFRKISHSLRPGSSAVSECMAASSPVGLNLKLKEIEGKAPNTGKNDGCLQGEEAQQPGKTILDVSGLYCVPANTTRASHNLSKSPISVQFAGLLPSGSLCQGCWGMAVGSGGLSWGLLLHAPLQCPALRSLSDSKTAELAKL